MTSLHRIGTPATAEATGSSPFQTSYTLVAGENRALVVAINCYATSVPTFTVKYSGITLTEITFSTIGNIHQGLYYLFEEDLPADGAHFTNVAWTGGTGMELQWTTDCADHVAQTPPVFDYDSASAGFVVTTDIDSNVNTWSFAAANVDAGGLTWEHNNDQDEIFDTSTLTNVSSTVTSTVYPGAISDAFTSTRSSGSVEDMQRSHAVFTGEPIIGVPSPSVIGSTTITWAAGTDPAPQDITVPDDCTAVYMVWTTWENGTNDDGVATLTLEGVNYQDFHQLVATGNNNTTSGGAAWYNPGTGANQTVDVTWDAAPGEGSTFAVIFVKDGDLTSGWRDADADESGGGGVNVTVDTLPNDLVIKFAERYDTGGVTPPALSPGWTNITTHANNDQSSRASYIIAREDTQFCGFEGDVNFSGIVGITIPGWGRPASSTPLLVHAVELTGDLADDGTRHDITAGAIDDDTSTGIADIGAGGTDGNAVRCEFTEYGVKVNDTISIWYSAKTGLASGIEMQAYTDANSVTATAAIVIGSPIIGENVFTLTQAFIDELGVIGHDHFAVRVQPTSQTSGDFTLTEVDGDLFDKVVGVSTSLATDGTSPETFQHTLVAAGNRIVFVGINSQSTSLPSYTVTYGGESMSELVTNRLGNINQSVWYILAADLPTNGVKDVVVSWTGGANHSMGVTCESVQNLTQATPSYEYATVIAGNVVTTDIDQVANSYGFALANVDSLGSAWTHNNQQVEIYELGHPNSSAVTSSLYPSAFTTEFASSFTGAPADAQRTHVVVTEELSPQIAFESTTTVTSTVTANLHPYTQFATTVTATSTVAGALLTFGDVPLATTINVTSFAQGSFVYAKFFATTINVVSTVDPNEFVYFRKYDTTIAATSAVTSDFVRLVDFLGSLTEAATVVAPTFKKASDLSTVVNPVATVSGVFNATRPLASITNGQLVVTASFGHTFTENISSLTPGCYIELFEIDTTVIGGGDVFRFIPGGYDVSNVFWQGNEYIRFPVQIDGFEWNATSQAPPQPTLTLSNVNKFVLAAVITLGDIVGAKVTRWRTYAQYLDDGEQADANAHFPPDIYRVQQKTGHTKQLIEWTLSSTLDLPGVRLPKRQILRDETTGNVYAPGVSKVRFKGR